jgi:hypothetical protein
VRQGQIKANDIPRANIQSKRVLFTLKNTMHAFNIMYILFTVSKNIFSPLQVNDKPCDGETGHAFIIGSLGCTNFVAWFFFYLGHCEALDDCTYFGCFVAGTF